MKKIALTLSCASSILLGASNEEIIEFYSKIIAQQIHGAELSIIKREKIPQSDFESVVIGINANGMKDQTILFTKDNIIVPDIIDIKNQISYRQEFEMQKLKESKENFEKNAKAELKKETMLISIGDKKKPSIYVFSDPECPYCRQHLKNIKQDLAKYQVHFILTPIHEKSAFEKSALIYKESKKAKNDDEKIAILNKYYDENIKNYPKVSENELLEVYKLYEKYTLLGLTQVPTIIKDVE